MRLPPGRRAEAESNLSEGKEFRPCRRRRLTERRVSDGRRGGRDGAATNTRLGGSAARRLGGSAARRLGGHYRVSPSGDCQPLGRNCAQQTPRTRCGRIAIHPAPAARQSAHDRVHPLKATPAHALCSRPEVRTPASRNHRTDHGRRANEQPAMSTATRAVTPAADRAWRGPAPRRALAARSPCFVERTGAHPRAGCRRRALGGGSSGSGACHCPAGGWGRIGANRVVTGLRASRGKEIANRKLRVALVTGWYGAAIHGAATGSVVG